MKKSERVRYIATTLGRRSIVFVGMMGCGKSAIGRLTAAELGLPYFDSDAEITTAADMTIAEIFERFGEDYFRKGEERVIARLLAEGPAVISLGGGAFMSEATRDLVTASAVSIWLKADIDLLLSRVMRRPGTRPLLANGNPRAILTELTEKRSPVYALADLHVESSRMSKKQTCENVLDSLQAWLEDHPRDTEMANTQ